MIEIIIYGDIVAEDVSDWWPDSVSPKQIHNELEDAAGEDLLVRFNSYGGSADAGVAISNRLKEYAGNVIGRVDGMAASAATIILMGCDTAEIADNAALMIHKASYFTYGQFNADDFRQYASQLDNYDQRIAATYAKRSGSKTADDFLTMMSKDTYLTASEAKEFGLVDQITDESDVEVHLTQKVADKLDLDAIPEGVAARLVIDPPRAKKSVKPLIERVRETRQAAKEKADRAAAATVNNAARYAKLRLSR